MRGDGPFFSLHHGVCRICVYCGFSWYSKCRIGLADFCPGRIGSRVDERFVDSKLDLPSLVVTIGTQFFWAGVTQVLSGGLGKTLVPTKASPLYPVLVGRIGGKLPAQMLWMAAIAFILWLILNHHRFGAHIYFTGDNPQSARVMGVNVDRVRMFVFTQMGGFAAFAGVLASLEVVYFWPTLGQGHVKNHGSRISGRNSSNRRSGNDFWYFYGLYNHRHVGSRNHCYGHDRILDSTGVWFNNCGLCGYVFGYGEEKVGL